MASRSLAEGIADQLCALKAELARCCTVASRTDNARQIYYQSRGLRIQKQIDELEARRKDEPIGGWQ